MNEELFDIEPIDIYSPLGEKNPEQAAKVIIRPLQYTLFSPTIGAYIEFQSEEGKTLIQGFNKYINTPEDWGKDDFTVIQSFIDALNLKIKK